MLLMGEASSDDCLSIQFVIPDLGLHQVMGAATASFETMYAWCVYPKV